MSVELKKAQRKRVKLKIGLSAPSGGGKTASALILSYGLVKGEHPNWTDEQIWDKIAIIDTENGSGELYSGLKIGTTNIGAYNAITLEPPFDPAKCIESIKACHEAGMEVCIIDSLSHFWNGQGGLLEKQGNVSKRTNNTWTAWREVTPQYNAMIDAILQTDMHMIATMRSKTAYVQDKDSNGKTTIVKKGLEPIIRDGAEYEFSIFMDIDTDHQAFVSKDRTSVLDGQYFVITPDIGKKLAKWLDGAVAEDTPDEVILTKTSEVVPEPIDTYLADIKKSVLECASNKIDKDIISKTIKEIAGTANYNKITDIDIAKKVKIALHNLETEAEGELDV